MRHIWLSSPLLLVPGIRYCTRKYNVPTAAIGTSRRKAFFRTKLPKPEDAEKGFNA